MNKDKTSSPAPEAVTLRVILKDIAISVLLLCGAWGVEYLKIQLSPIPFTTLIILSVSEMTLIAYFFGALFRALKWSWNEFDALLTDVNNSRSWRRIRKTLITASRLLIKLAVSAHKLLARIFIFLGFVLIGLQAAYDLVDWTQFSDFTIGAPVLETPILLFTSLALIIAMVSVVSLTTGLRLLLPRDR